MLCIHIFSKKKNSDSDNSDKIKITYINLYDKVGLTANTNPNYLQNLRIQIWWMSDGDTSIYHDTLRI